MPQTLEASGLFAARSAEQSEKSLGGQKVLEPEKLMPLVYEEVVKDFSYDCCISATGTLIDVLEKRYSVEAYPLMVELMVFNPFVTELIEKHGFPEKANVALLESWTSHNKGWCVGVGLKGQGKASDGTLGLDGHLVAIAIDDQGQRAIMDPSLGQAARPNRGMPLTPLCFRVNDVFLKGEKSRGVIVHGCLHMYRAHAGNKRFKKAPDWKKVRRIDAIDRVLKRLDLESPLSTRG